MMQRSKRSVRQKASSWTPEVAKALVSEHFERKRAHERRSKGLVRSAENSVKFVTEHQILSVIRQVTKLHDSGDVTTEHFIDAVRRWSEAEVGDLLKKIQKPSAVV